LFLPEGYAGRKRGKVTIERKIIGFVTAREAYQQSFLGCLC